MSTKHHNLSQLDAPLPSAADMKFGIVVAEWNREITEALLEGAVQTLRSAGCSDLNIQIKYVPGTFELTLGNGYDVNATYASKDAIIFGGGIGIPPMLELAKQLNCKKQIVLGYKDELFLNEEFEKYGTVTIATEDGS